jgi:hypothetical protein
VDKRKKLFFGVVAILIGRLLIGIDIVIEGNQGSAIPFRLST